MLYYEHHKRGQPVGFFGKLKENMHHGGIQIRLDAPNTVSTKDATLPVTVHVSAADEQQTIESVFVAIIATQTNQAFDLSNANQAAANPSSERHTVAQAAFTEPFVLQPGEARDVQLAIVMNQAAALNPELPENGMAAQVMNAMQKMQTLAEASGLQNYSYMLEAWAKVSGIRLSPAHSQNLQILGPGQFGSMWQKQIHL